MYIHMSIYNSRIDIRIVIYQLILEGYNDTMGYRITNARFGFVQNGTHPKLAKL